MKNYIQLITGLIIQFDIKQSPMKFNENGIMIIYLGYVHSPAFNSTISNMKIARSYIIADWEDVD